MGGHTPESLRTAGPACPTTSDGAPGPEGAAVSLQDEVRGPPRPWKQNPVVECQWKASGNAGRQSNTTELEERTTS